MNNNVYYFEVELFQMSKSTILVKAKDIIDAGEKAGARYGDEYIVRITRTKITEIID